MLCASGTPVAAKETDRGKTTDGGLGPALAALARQAGWQIFYTPEVVAGCRRRNARSIEGRMGNERDGSGNRAKLDRILARCHLRARWLGPALVVVLEARPPRVSPTLAVPPARAPAGDQSIVVTALRYETRLNLTPLAISVATSADLGHAADTSLSGLSRMLPALGLFDTGAVQQRLILRGISGTGEPTVAVYYDETPVSGPAGNTVDAGASAPDLALVDIDRVELIRGPQGTLFGGSAMGGALRVLFRRPELAEPSAEVSAGVIATAGAPLGVTATGMVNLPLRRDRLGLRLVGYGDTKGGYIDNVTLGLDDRGRVTRRGVRAALSWLPAPGWRIEATGAYQHLASNDVRYWTASTGTHLVAQPTVAPMTSDLGLASLTASAELRAMKVLLTASHYAWKQVLNEDYNAVIGGARASAAGCQRYENQPGPCSAAQMDDYAAYVDSRLPAALRLPFSVVADSVELRATSPAGARRWTWTAGLFFQSRRDKADSYAVRADKETGRIIDPLDITGHRHIATNLTQWAAFGEVTRSLTSRLALTAGLRHFDYLRTARNSVPIPNVITGTADIDTLGRRVREGGQIGKLGLTWTPEPALMLYASATQGFRPGGTNTTPGLTASQITFRSDSLISYEVGAKFHPAHRAIGVDVALYHIDWSDMILAVDSANGAFTYNTNVGAVAVNGGELSLRWSPWAGGSIRLELSANDAHLAADQRVASAAGIGRRGDRLPNAAKTSGSIDYTHTANLGQGISGSAGLGVVYVGGSASQFNPGMTFYARTDTVTILRAKADLELGRYALALEVDNLLDVKTAVRTQPLFDGSIRIFGVSPLTARLVGSVRF